MRSRRALLGVLSMAAVLVPAAGIAYLGAVSYRDDRGIVAARLADQFATARAVATALEAEVRATLDEVAREAVAPDGPLLPRAESAPAARFAGVRTRRPLAAFPFHIRKGALVFPPPEPLGGAPAGVDELLSLVPRTCPERGFDRCILAIRAARRRQAQLEAAQRRELGECAAGPCARDAARTYAALARWDDTGPEALIGLARIAWRRGDTRAVIDHYRALGERFGGRYDRERVSYQLVADLGGARAAARSTGNATPLLEVFRRLVARDYRAPSPMLSLVAEDLAAALETGRLAVSHAREVDRLQAELAAARREARFAAALAGEVDELARSATERSRGRPALADPERTLIYRLVGRGDVVGIVVDEAMLEQVAAGSGVDVAAIAPGAHAIVERLGERRGPGQSPGQSPSEGAGESPGQDEGELRTLASAGFGPVLPHLQVALVNDRALPDPLDASIEARGRRHIAITGALVAVLLFGIAVTVRGAARARELARLKSDFVSTVSHELKTPLTSIRMFGEMLQQGVAAGDREREARYQDIIVKESERLGLLIANLLDYAQIERGTRRYDARPQRAIDVAREAVDTFQRVREGEVPAVRLAAPGGVDGGASTGTTDATAQAQTADILHGEILPAEVLPADILAAEILVDREVVVQSLLNLLSNAAKYGGPDHPIDVRVEVRSGAGGRVDAGASDSREVAVIVSDRGPGIPASEHERIFREFYRAPAAYASGVEGTGLGLALVKRHVEAQGGRVEIDSAPGRGAAFALVFPLAAGSARAPAVGVGDDAQVPSATATEVHAGTTAAKERA